MRARDVHAAIGKRWPLILERLGIPGEYLTNRHGPCLVCGGKDRYRFDNHQDKGGFFCNRCGSGDGFALLQRVHGWDFRTTLDRVVVAAGLADEYHGRAGSMHITHDVRNLSLRPMATLTNRVRRLQKESCAIADCKDAVEYLASRAVWPVAAATTLKAHVSVEYYYEGKRVGRYPALVADVRDIDGAMVTAHVTYLASGRKLQTHEPRKLLSPLTGRSGCAVRLVPINGDTLGLAEGIETALAASKLHGLPVWAALNTTLLAKFEPPTTVKKLIIFADRDAPGLHASEQLVERLKGRVLVKVRVPEAPFKDWNDVTAAS